MEQIHPGPASRAGKRFGSEQLRFLFRAYVKGNVKGTDVHEVLGIGNSPFLDLLKEYRQGPETFSLSYERATPCRLSVAEEAGRGFSAAHLRLQLFGPARSSGEEGDPCLRNNDHDARQSLGLLSAPAQEQIPRPRSPNHFYRTPGSA